MKLIGMLDSPYVRRVAISMQLLGIEFEHLSLSVFRAFDQIAAINPVVKVPTLECDDGTVLMDSTLILQWLERQPRRRSLLPLDPADFLRAQRISGLALAGCEKSVQLLYERMRPADRQHPAWLERVIRQAREAYAELERELAAQPLAHSSGTIMQPGVDAAVAWQFAAQVVPDLVAAADHPQLSAFSAQAEALPEFIAAPHGEASFRGRG